VVYRQWSLPCILVDQVPRPGIRVPLVLGLGIVLGTEFDDGINLGRAIDGQKALDDSLGVAAVIVAAAVPGGAQILDLVEAMLCTPGWLRSTYPLTLQCVSAPV
jgi:hypothetical protein